MFKLSRNSM